MKKFYFYEHDDMICVKNTTLSFGSFNNMMNYFIENYTEEIIIIEQIDEPEYAKKETENLIEW